MADEQVPAQVAIQQAQSLLQPVQPPVAGPNHPVEPNPAPLQVHSFSFLLVLFLLFRLSWLACTPVARPVLSLYAIVSISSLYVCFTVFFCSALPFALVKFFARLCFALFSKFCYACFASETSGLCSAIPSVPESFLHACVLFYYSVSYVMRALPHEHRVCAVLFPRFLESFLHACVLFYYSVSYVMRALPHKHRFVPSAIPIGS